MSEFILFVYLIVAGGNGFGVEREWRAQGYFKTQAACEQAGKTMQLKYRCIPTQ